MSEADFSKTVAVAVDLKAIVTDHDFWREFDKDAETNANSKAGAMRAEQFFHNLVGLAVDASLDSSTATVTATLLGQDANFVTDAKELIGIAKGEAARRLAEHPGGRLGELSNLVDSIKFTVSGAKIKGSLQTSLEPLSNWIKEQAMMRQKNPKGRASCRRHFRI